ncbi:MAG: UvrD-helicase domain-containing protein [Cardiobacteriaceae bacterium]|nr:UvrD-helicase domain-containing protein [Cardiobacteriaceae bacterium]
MTTPALTIPLRGRVLIEASAGTGKTWTLTGIILRLLIERGLEPRDIIATTFTRKAAAEMQHRVQTRLYDFRECLKRIARRYSEDATFLYDDDGLAARLQALLDEHAEDDVINRHLVLHAIGDGGLDGLIQVMTRTELLQNRLDELFIGTIDSLCQRWLAEFSLETGSDERLQINENSDALGETLHDNLRQVRHEYAVRFPELYERLLVSGKQYDSNAYLSVAKKIGQHSHTPIATVTLPDFDHAQHQDLLGQLAAAEDAGLIEDWQRFINGAAFSDAVKKGAAWYKRREHLPTFLHQLKHDLPLNEDTEKLAKGIAEPNFKKNHDALLAEYYAHPLTQLLSRLLASRAAQQQGLDLLQAATTARLLENVREQLPHALEARGETTFSEKIAHLNRALAGEGGIALARYIVHRYRALLVDESQDLNSEQAALIEHIYLRADDKDSFLLLVGDPKQAIYGFRGGNVANYNHLKQYFRTEEQQQLLTNRRSSKALINALNEHYTQENNAHLGDNIAYQVAEAVKEEGQLCDIQGKSIAAPLIWFDSGNNTPDETDVIAALIDRLIADSSPYGRKQADGSISRLKASDIQVLMRSNNSLKTLQTALHTYGIDSELQTDENLFQGAVAHAFADLLAAILTPQRSDSLNRLLSGIYYGRSQAALDRLAGIEQGEMTAEKDELTLTSLRDSLYRAREQWQPYGLLAAITPLLDHPQHSIWQTLAAYPAPECLRYLLDLRHIQQILAEHAPRQRPAIFYQWWQAQLAAPPEAEWAIVPPLPGKDAVRLLTIHKAKGLQSPVVILATGRNRGTDNSPIKLYQTYEGEKPRLSPLKPDEDTCQHNQQKEQEEKARLLYVGLTRAEDLLFVAHRNKNGEKSTETLFNSRENSPHSQYLTDPVNQLKQDALILKAPIHDDAYNTTPNGQPWEKTRYYGWQRTSFSALLREGIESMPDVDLADYAVAEAQTAVTTPLDAEIRYSFPRGTAAGSFLHAVLEKLHSDNRHDWLRQLKQQATYWQIPLNEATLNACIAWLTDIFASRCPQSGIDLATCKRGMHQNELGFSLGIDDRQPLNMARINQLFAAENKAVNLRDSKKLYRYIRGEIDLTYQHDNRYYILDYKSNHLGDQITDYRQEALHRAMDDHHYWLQGALYQIALHRLLKTRLTDYAPEHHLGGIEYLYLRGIRPDNANLGSLGWRFSTDFILELDQLLGYQQ